MTPKALTADDMEALALPRRKKPAALTPRTLKLLRADGWGAVEVVEHWNSHVGIRQDLFGIFDVLGVGREGTIAVQVCRRDVMASRRSKISESANIGPVREAGWKVVIHGWWQDKARRWRVKIEDVS